MSIQLAVMGCIAASAKKDYGLTLPPSISGSTSGVGNRHLILGSDAPTSNTLIIYGTDFEQKWNWNPNSEDRSLFEFQVTRISGSADVTGSHPWGTWIPGNTNWYYKWDQTAVGTNSSVALVKIREASTGDVLVSTEAAISVQKTSYGITLPASLPLSVSGTGEQKINVATGHPTVNEFHTNQNGVINNTLWNPNGHSASLFQVRMVHVSGSAATAGGMGPWYPMTSQQTWQWLRNTAGSLSGTARLEIREIATEAILAQSNVTISVNRVANVYASPVSSSAFTTTTTTASAQASINWNIDGLVSAVGGAGHRWMESGGNPAQFQIMFTHTGGTAPTGSALNSWLTLNVNRPIRLTATGSYNSARLTSQGSYQIRRISDGAIMASSTWSLVAEVQYIDF